MSQPGNFFTIHSQIPTTVQGPPGQRDAPVVYGQPFEMRSLPPLSQLLPGRTKAMPDQQPPQLQPASLGAHPQQSMFLGDFMMPTPVAVTPAVTGMTTTTTATQPSQVLSAVAVAAASTMFPASTIPTSVSAASVPTGTITAHGGPTLTDPSYSEIYTSTETAAIMLGYMDGRSASDAGEDKVYSFVEIPGSIQRKRPRRRYDEIERLYHCTWPSCTKAYGTLNHLNAHVSMQKHGPKRHPSEFKEMRKEWRRQKKERDSAKKPAEKATEVMNSSSHPLSVLSEANAAAAVATAASSMSYPFQSTYESSLLSGFYP